MARIDWNKAKPSGKRLITKMTLKQVEAMHDKWNAEKVERNKKKKKFKKIPITDRDNDWRKEFE